MRNNRDTVDRLVVTSWHSCTRSWQLRGLNYSFSYNRLLATFPIPSMSSLSFLWLYICSSVIVEYQNRRKSGNKSYPYVYSTRHHECYDFSPTWPKILSTISQIIEVVFCRMMTLYSSIAYLALSLVVVGCSPRTIMPIFHHSQLWISNCNCP